MQETALHKKIAIAALFPVGALSYGIDLLAALEGGGARGPALPPAPRAVSRSCSLRPLKTPRVCVRASDRAGSGAVWATLWTRPGGANGLSFGWVLELLLFQIVLHTFLGWYFEQALPSKYGVRQPPWFVFLPSYWKPPPAGADAAAAAAATDSADQNELHGFSALQAGESAQGALMEEV